MPCDSMIRNHNEELATYQTLLDQSKPVEASPEETSISNKFLEGVAPDNTIVVSRDVETKVEGKKKKDVRKLDVKKCLKDSSLSAEEKEKKLEASSLSEKIRVRNLGQIKKRKQQQKKEKLKKLNDNVAALEKEILQRRKRSKQRGKEKPEVKVDTHAVEVSHLFEWTKQVRNFPFNSEDEEDDNADKHSSDEDEPLIAGNPTNYVMTEKIYRKQVESDLIHSKVQDVHEAGETLKNMVDNLKQDVHETGETLKNMVDNLKQATLSND